MIHFLRYTKIYILISAIVIGLGLFSIVRWGYAVSIDFVGGSLFVVSSNSVSRNISIEQIFLKKKIKIQSMEKRSDSVTIRTVALSQDKFESISQELRSASPSFTILKSETVGPTIGMETVKKTLVASFLGLIAILSYMAFAFRGWQAALSAVVATLHDLLVIFGMYSLLSHFFGAQLDTLFVTAVLTSMSFSVHDTIVVFDKIREYQASSYGSLEDQANRALTQTMVRSFNNSMTIIFMLLALVLLGGSTIRFFACALLVGTITGTYSSPFVATPLFVWLKRKFKN